MSGCEHLNGRTLRSTRLTLLSALLAAGAFLHPLAARAQVGGFLESWRNLDLWNSVGVVVSDGALYGSDGLAGANRLFSVGATGSARLVATLTLPDPATNGTGYVFVGVSGDTVGAAPTAGDPNGLGVGVNFVDSIYREMVFNKGALAWGPDYVQAGHCTVDVSIDPNFISLCLVDAAHTIEFLQRTSRSSFGAINNVHVWNSDDRGAKGIAIDSLAVASSPETNLYAATAQGQGDFVVWTTDRAGHSIRLWAPASYDPRVAAPLVLFCHGDGWDETFPWYGQSPVVPGFNPERPFFQAIVNAGYIVASSDLFGNNWGNQTGVDSERDLLTWIKGRYAVSNVFVMGASMGGLTGLNFIQQHPGEVSGFAGALPGNEPA